MVAHGSDSAGQAQPSETATGYAIRAEQKIRGLYFVEAQALLRLAWNAGKRGQAGDDWLYGIANRYWQLADLTGDHTAIVEA